MPLLQLLPNEFRELNKLADLGGGPRLLLRYRIILLASKQDSVSEIGHQLKTSRNNVRLWIRRFKEHRTDGLTTLPGRGPKLMNGELSKAIGLKLGDNKELSISQRELAEDLHVSLASINRELRRQNIHSTTYRGRWRDHAADKSLIGIYLDPPFSIFAVRNPVSQPSASDVHTEEAASLEFDRALSAFRDVLAKLPKSAGQQASLGGFLRQLRRIAWDGQIELWTSGRLKDLQHITGVNNGFQIQVVSGCSPPVAWPHNVLAGLKPLIKNCAEFETWARHIRLIISHRRHFGSVARPWFRTLVRSPLGSVAG